MEAKTQSEKETDKKIIKNKDERNRNG